MRSLSLAIVLITVIIAPSVLVYSEKGEVFRYYFWAPCNFVMYIVGYNKTNFRFYNLSAAGTRKALSFEDSIGRMELKVYDRIVLGYYLIESDNRLFIMLKVADHIDSDVGTYIPATSGGFLGQEFIFYPRGTITILAYEDTKVTVYNSKGKKLYEFHLWQNETKYIAAVAGEVYRVVSTGRIAIIQTGEVIGTNLIDCRNLPRGKYFLGKVHRVDKPYVMVIAYEPCKVILHFKDKKYEHTFTKDEVEKMKVWILTLYDLAATSPVRVESTGDVTIYVCTMGSAEYGIGNYPSSLGLQVAIPANVEYKAITPGGGVIFTPYETKLEIDGAIVETVAGQFIPISGNTVHVVKANKPVIIQIRGSSGGYQAPDDGFCLVSDKDAIVLPPPKPSEKGKGGELGISIEMIAIVAIVVVLVLALAMLRKRKAS